jgi:RND superfamily putative drug exporter
MSAFLFRLGRSCARHPFRVLGLWLVAAVAVVTLQGAAGGHYDNSIRVPGVESQRAADTLRDRFLAQSGKTARIVFHTTDARLDDTDPNGHRGRPSAARHRA